MIVVIADDLTGAAELGGLGLKYGLKVEVSTTVNLHSKADLLVISTDTRSMERKEAVETTTKVTALIKDLSPAIIYKKTDSVLRGHVLDELRAQMKALELTRALLVPANPVLGRTIINGIYFIRDQPIHLTSFSSDPEFPIRDSSVLNMLGKSDFHVEVKKTQHEFPTSGITVGEASTVRDLEAWAAKADSKTMVLAGAAGFFTALLERIYKKKSLPATESISEPGPCLFICGSTFDKSRQLINDVKERGGPVCYMPLSIIDSIHSSETLYKEWCGDVAKLLNERGKAIIAIDKYMTERKELSAKDLREKTALAVSLIMKEVFVSELIIEGGSTAAAIIRTLRLTNFFPVKEYATGIVRMKVGEQVNLYFTLKPGSYSWPVEVWNF